MKRSVPFPLAASARRRAIGVEITEGGAQVRLWAPDHSAVSLAVDGEEFPLQREDTGHFAGFVEGLEPGTRYRFRLHDSGDTLPDPASRFQPEGPHGESEIIDPSTFTWSDQGWSGITLHGAVISEIHVGTFTPEGTFAAAAEKLPLLADIGINLIEILPIAEFPGRFGWGYDGVDLYAPSHLYGRPDDFRAFVDRAHAIGMGVILDVVYNHFGPDGCYLANYASSYFTDRYVNDWGAAVNFEGAEAAGVRELVIENAAYWIDEFHLDGLRLDATQSIHDASPRHVIADITDAARRAAGQRRIIVVAENEPQDVVLLDRYGCDALWNDDWHHASRVAITGRREAYYLPYRGKPQEFISMLRRGFLYQGQHYRWQKQGRGTPSDHLDAERFITYLQNHDQVANSARGERLWQIGHPGMIRAMTALLLLAPQTPMLFQGQEFGASSPFLYFADHKSELAGQVDAGRKEFLTQFASLAGEDAQQRLAPPNDPRTFAASRLDWSERDTHRHIADLHRDLITLRRTDAVFASQRREMIEGAVLSEQAFVFRWFAGGNADRLLLINHGPQLDLDILPESLLAPPRTMRWKLIWSSESPRYGGQGAARIGAETPWTLPPYSALVLAPVET